MQTNFKKKFLCVALCMMFAGHAYTAHANHNPASIGYVDEAIEAAFQRSIYTAGTAINIVNNVISGAYTAGTGIIISSEGVISEETVSVGDNFHGATVFYVDASGHHGLAVNTAGDSFKIGSASLLNSTAFVNAVATGTGVGAGVSNTSIWNAALLLSRSLAGIVPATNDNGAAELASNYSAQEDGAICAAASTTPNANLCFGAYYLPSLAEFELLVKSGLLNTPSGTWWTSTSDPATAGNAFAIYKSGGTDNYTIESREVTDSLLVLPVKLF